MILPHTFAYIYVYIYCIYVKFVWIHFASLNILLHLTHFLCVWGGILWMYYYMPMKVKWQLAVINYFLQPCDSQRLNSNHQAFVKRILTCYPILLAYITCTHIHMWSDFLVYHTFFGCIPNYYFVSYKLILMIHLAF